MLRKLWSAWVRFTTWFDQKPVQIVYSIVAVICGLWMFLGATRPFYIVFGIFAMIFGALNLIMVLTRSSRDDDSSAG